MHKLASHPSSRVKEKVRKTLAKVRPMLLNEKKRNDVVDGRRKINGCFSIKGLGFRNMRRWQSVNNVDAFFVRKLSQLQLLISGRNFELEISRNQDNTCTTQ